MDNKKLDDLVWEMRREFAAAKRDRQELWDALNDVKNNTPKGKPTAKKKKEKIPAIRNWDKTYYKNTTDFVADQEYTHRHIREGLDTYNFYMYGNHIIKLKGNEELAGTWVSTIWLPNLYQNQPVVYVSETEIEITTKKYRSHESLCDMLDAAVNGQQGAHFFHRTEDKTFFYIGKMKSYIVLEEGLYDEASKFKITLVDPIGNEVKDRMQKVTELMHEQ